MTRTHAIGMALFIWAHLGAPGAHAQSPPPETAPEPPPGYQSAEPDPSAPAEQPPQDPGRSEPQGRQDPQAHRPTPPRARERRLVPYEQGMRIPPGGKVVGRRVPGLWIPGVIVFGVFYISTVSTWSSTSEAREDNHGIEVVAPVVGPFLRAANVDGDGVLDGLLRTSLVLDGLAQTAGVALFIAGMVEREYVMYWTTGQGRNVALLPTVGRGAAGVHLHVW